MFALLKRQIASSWGQLQKPRSPTGFLFLGLIGLAAFVTLASASWLVRHAIAINKLSRGVGQTIFYGADGRAWFPLEEHRRDVPLNRVSPYLQRAVIAIEDHRFDAHPGVDSLAIGRAVVRNTKAGAIIEGGSTLTQQLARTLFLSTSRSYARKLKEIVLALMIELRLSKPHILELYLNRIYLGGNVYGVEAMSQNLLGKSAADLTLAESALIAGLIRAPSSFSPWSHFDSAVRRSHVVLARMREEHLITPEEERAARTARLRIRPEPGLTAGARGYATEFLRQEFHREFGDDEPPDWKVLTSFLPAVQAEAERAVITGLSRLRVPGLQAALVALDPRTGDVLALIGGRDFGRSPFNRALKAKRQPGSAFKPFVYAAALERGLSPISVLSHLTDLQVPGQDEWVVRNANAEIRASLTLRDALAESNNQAAVRLQQQIGSKPVLQLAHASGLQHVPDVPSLALGTGEVSPFELTAAYAVFANGGFAVQPRTLRRVLDASGSTAFDNPIRRHRVVSEATAFQMVTMLQDVIARGTGSAAQSLGVRFPAGGKTGTTDDFRDAWFVGFSSSVVAGVWVGFDQPMPIAPDGYGSRYALPIWAEFMTRVARVLPPQPFTPPASVHDVLLCRVTHLRAGDRCPAYREYFKLDDVVLEAECREHRGKPFRYVVTIENAVARLARRLRGIFGH